ncbi:hypothetical protein OF83DRAFT_1112231 [Amylostereum chailletii]|nr:hypothetical protein OF83DRAFT_1112231 [Amylostereum chailletii]
MSVKSRSSHDWAPSFPTSSVRKINYFDLWRKKKAVKEATKRYGVFKFNNGRVFRMGHDAVVKFGGPLTVRPTEAATMEYIAKYTTIPVPRVRDVFKEGKNTWIVMDYIDGQPLDQVWPTLTPDERIKCMQQLKGYIDQLRALRSTPDCTIPPGALSRPSTTSTGSLGTKTRPSFILAFRAGSTRWPERNGESCSRTETWHHIIFCGVTGGSLRSSIGRTRDGSRNIGSIRGPGIQRRALWAKASGSCFRMSSMFTLTN